MPGKDQMTGRGPGFGNNVSFSNRKTRRRWDLNLQTRHIVVDGVKKKVRVSTKWLRTELKHAAL